VTQTKEKRLAGAKACQAIQSHKKNFRDEQCVTRDGQGKAEGREREKRMQANFFVVKKST
jgi:hypothetical protein